MFRWSLTSFPDIIVVTHAVVQIARILHGQKKTPPEVSFRRKTPEDVIVLARNKTGRQRNVIVPLNDPILYHGHIEAVNFVPVEHIDHEASPVARSHALTPHSSIAYNSALFTPSRKETLEI